MALTRLTVNLTPPAAAALAAAADQTRDSPTDTLNLAVLVYARIVQAHDEGRGRAELIMHEAPGGPCHIDINRRPWWRFWRSR